MILNLHKPPGMTSHDVVHRIRKITGERRVGHAGTLDPFATGVLVIGITRASTKMLGLIANHTEKEYEATLVLGKTSTTGDPEGDIRETCDTSTLAHITVEHVISILHQFVGEVEQRPPIYSALKIKGRPAYALAREGKEVVLPPRKVTISDISLQDINLPHLKLHITCSSGTYIRSIARDIGEKLGVGAYLTTLIRTRVGNFRIEAAQTLEDIACSFAQSRYSHALAHEAQSKA